MLAGCVEVGGGVSGSESKYVRDILEGTFWNLVRLDAKEEVEVEVENVDGTDEETVALQLEIESMETWETIAGGFRGCAHSRRAGGGWGGEDGVG